MKNALVAAAYSYNPTILEPFLFSFRKWSQDRILLIINPGESRELDIISRKYNVELVEDDASIEMPAIKRYSAKLRVVRRLRQVNQILISDSRDVFFQGCPFSFHSLAPLNFALEPALIGDCQINMGWINQIYGEFEARRMISLPVSCSGTTLGRIDEIEGYLCRMVDEFSRLTSIGVKLPHGGDQGVHNYLVHFGGMRGVRLHENNEGLFTTLHHQKNFTFDRAGRILNRDLSIAIVVHQYDRLSPYFRGAFASSCFNI